MRTKAARDHNEPEIVDALRKHGYFVTPVSSPAVPDLIVISPLGTPYVHVCETAEQAIEAAGKGSLTLIEVKKPGGKLTQTQQAWHEKANR